MRVEFTVTALIQDDIHKTPPTPGAIKHLILAGQTELASTPPDYQMSKTERLAMDTTFTIKS